MERLGKGEDKLEKEKIKEKFKEVGKCYANMKPENKKILLYSAIGFVSGFMLGFILKKRR